MLKKLNNKKGFTLMEMLIVVAIIAVLVAIAIPVFNGALTKAKESADVANVRAMYAEWQIAIISGDAKTTDVTSDSFLAGPNKGTAIELNYDKQLEITDGKIVYKATKLTNETTNDKNFSWTLGDPNSTGTSADSTT